MVIKNIYSGSVYKQINLYMYMSIYLYFIY